MMGIEDGGEVVMMAMGIKGKSDGERSRWASGSGATASERMMGIRDALAAVPWR
jgi:hypothetical protein